MKLIAKAKPVKIRITSGNEEHSSLESLRKNFVWKEVKELLDGSLDRWLRCINAVEIADKLKDIANPENDILAIYNLLFRGNSPFTSEKEIFDELLKDRNLMSLAEEIVTRLPVIDDLKFVKKYEDEKVIFSLFKNRIVEVAKSFDENFEDGELLFEVGQFLNNHSIDPFYDDIPSIAYNCIELAARKGISGAIQFLEFYSNKNKEDFWAFYQKPEVRSRIDESWTKNDLIKFDGNCLNAKILFDFSDTCLKLYKKRYDYMTSKPFHRIASEDFGSFGKSDPLYEEKMFVLSLFNRYAAESLECLQTINNYSLAKEILESNKHIFEYKGHVFDLENKRDNACELHYFVTHLLELRNYGNSIETSSCNNNDFWNFIRKNRITDKIDESWDKEVPVIITNDIGGHAQTLIEFSNTCLKIFKYKKRYSSDYYEIAKREFGKLDKTDSLYQEKMFVLALFTPYRIDGISLLEKNRDYPPAKMMLHSNYNYYAHFWNYRFQIMDYENNRSVLKYFVTHLFEFRNYGKSN